MSGQLPDPDSANPTPLGIYDRPGRQAISGIEIAALILTLIWLVGSIVFFIKSPATLDGMQFLITALVIFMPIGMIWVAATAARSARVMREESLRLQTAIDAIRQAYVAQQQRATIGPEPRSARSWTKLLRQPKRPKPRWRPLQPPAARPNAPLLRPCVLWQPMAAIRDHWSLEPLPKNCHRPCPPKTLSEP